MSEESKKPSGSDGKSGAKSGNKRGRRWGRRRRKPSGGGGQGGQQAQASSGGSGQQSRGARKGGDGSGGNQPKHQGSESAKGSGRSDGRGRRRGRRRSSKKRGARPAEGDLRVRETQGQQSRVPMPEDHEPGVLQFLLPDWEPDPDGEDVLASVEDQLDAIEEIPEGPLVDVACAHMQGTFPVEDVDSGDLTLEPGDRVVISTDKGQVSGTVVTGSVRRVRMDGKLARALRHFDHGDLRQEARNRRKARDAFVEGRERIKARSLPMKLVGVDFLHSGNRAIFYFTAEGRVDFRELIRDLARRLRVRIEMRQIGIRDQAGLVGGMGTCGRPLCCATFLRKFEQVSIRMAKDQNLVLNPQKISGQCGRLKCCLCYEHQLYREMGKGLPRQGKRVVTPKGRGRVAELDVLRRRVRVMLEDGGSEVFSADDVRRPER